MTVVLFRKRRLDKILGLLLAPDVAPAVRRLDVERVLTSAIKRAEYIGEYDLANALRGAALGLQKAREDECNKQTRKRMAWWRRWLLCR